MNNFKQFRDNSILRYMSEIDFDDDNTNEIILLHLTNGDLDDVYSNNILDKLDGDKKKDLLNKAGRYIHLCFKDGDYLKYTKSVKDTINDKNIKLNLVLNNYDFVIKIASKDIDILKELDKLIDNKEFNKTSVIDTIRYKFENDDKLIDCISNFIKTEKLYNLFDDKKRSILYLNPTVLYDKNGNRSSLDVAVKLYNHVNKKRLSSDEVKNNKEMVDMIYDFINSKDYKFEDAVEGIL